MMRTIFNRMMALAVVVTLTATTAQARYFKTVVIDAGHGGHDKGAQWGQVYEKHLCLDTATRLEAQLKAMGFRTVMTRSSDNFVSLPGRVDIANRYPDAIFVAVHYNFTWNQDANGLETFYCNSAESQKLAQMVQSNVVRKVRATDRGTKFARYYVIRHPSIPSILVECGFVSNSTERNKMKSAWYRESLAKGIAEAVMRYRRSG
ncbi:MAG: N-acetylmuramoyl-L-alanine amidase [Verrucomicrobiales bacterium]